MSSWDLTLAAVRTIAHRVAELIRSVPDAGAPALGNWDAGQLSAHMVHVFEVDRDLINEVPSPLSDLEDLSELTQSKVRDESRCDPPALAARVEAAAAAFLSVAEGMDGTEPRHWLGGVKVTSSVLACHIVSESVLHGLDLSRVVGRPWPLEREHARLAFEGFICPMYRSLGRPSYAVDQQRAAGVRACYDLRVHGGNRVFFVFEDGGLKIEPPSDRRVDCRISIDPRALMLLAWHRTGLVAPVVRGQVLPWGRKPWLALRLPGLIKTP
ncbi:MAG: SCP2 sterol-binding domain-containing protein [Actinomycetota bacterium]|nr:SCP2 sterol-binding domain-containing protein [Actinomycetota bacterium]